MRSSLYVATTVRAYAQAINSLNNEQKNELEFWAEDLNKIPNRGYTTGFLVEPADSSSIMDPHSKSAGQYKMAGIVLVIDQVHNRFAFAVKNKLTIGDRLEILMFSGGTIDLELRSLRNLADQTLDMAQPNSVVWLPLKPGIEALNIGRKPG